MKHKVLDFLNALWLFQNAQNVKVFRRERGKICLEDKMFIGK